MSVTVNWIWLGGRVVKTEKFRKERQARKAIRSRRTVEVKKVKHESGTMFEVYLDEAVQP